MSSILPLRSSPASTYGSATSQSIALLAQSKGVSTHSITQYVETQIQQQRASNGQQPLDQQTVAHAANRIVSGQGHHHHHGHRGGSSAVSSSTSPDAASAQPTDPFDSAEQPSIDLFA
jgi:hypothetical protein